MVPQGPARTAPTAFAPAALRTVNAAARLRRVIAILGGLGAAILWATATLASSRSSRMIGSRVVLAWVMVVGTVVGLPVALVSGVPATVSGDALALMALAGICYSAGLYTTYRALTIGKVSVVAPIVATEGAIGALIAVARGDPLTVAAMVLLGIVAIGVVLAAVGPARPDVPAGDIELAADALEGPAPEATIPATVATPATHDPLRTGEAALFAIVAAAIFGVGLVAAGKAALLVPPIWVAMSSRFVGLVVVALPLILQRRFTVTRAALPLVVIAGIGEVFGSTASAWGATDSIPIVAVLGSQFAAIAAVVAFLLFGERLSRSQVLGVILIVAGVSALAATSL
jgi:drug/metabolite transporter (DMT)-like permease